MKQAIYLCLAVLVISSCSNSEDDVAVYDDVLSHTKWMQDYITNKSVVISESFGIPEYIKNKLNEVTLPAVERTDTIWDIDSSKGKYILTFGNNDCKLEDVHYSDGNYRIHKFIRKETYYPDQSHSWTDDSGKLLYEAIISKDTLYFKVTDIGEGKDELLSDTKMYASHTYDDTTLSLSAAFPYSNEKIFSYHMTFTRNARNIVLSGDRHIVGVMNEERNKIEFSELGTLSLE